VKAFITGATGFVGSHVAEQLVQRGDEVLALARRPDAHTQLAALGCTSVAASLDDGAALRAALAGADIVYHIAGAISAASADEFFAVNEGGTRKLIAAVRDAAPHARFVYVSSQAALGPSPRHTPLDEDAAANPVTAYGRSKLAGERAVQTGGLAWTIVRPPSVYGPRDREFLQLFQVVKRGMAPVFGDGSQQLSLVYVEDLARAIILAGTAPVAAARVYHAAHGEIALARDVAKEAGRAIGRNPIVLPLPGAIASPIVALVGAAARLAGRRTVINSDKMAEFLAPAWLLSAARAERELGWKATVALREGMQLTGQWYRDRGWI